MAAHVYTALKEMSERPMNLETIQHGLGYALFGDQLSLTDWESLVNAPDSNRAREIATSLLIKYQEIWEYLGKPATAEDWNAAWFAMKGKARQKYWDMTFRKVQS